MKRNKQVYEMTLTAIIGAIILVMSLIPQIGFIRILPGVSVTIVHIPVIFGVFFLSFKYSLTLGFFFGLGSFIASLIYASTPFDLAFINPLISILPRMLFAAAAYWVAVGFKKIATFKYGKQFMFGLVSVVTAIGVNFGIDQLSTNRNVTVPIAIILIIIIVVLYYFTTIKNKHHHTYIPSVFILSTLVHTVLVLGAVVIFNPKVFIETFGDSQSILYIIYAIAAANGVIEAFIGALIGTPITLAALTKLDTTEE